MAAPQLPGSDRRTLELARAMHGDLTLESEEGTGSVFTLTLPNAREKQIEDYRLGAVGLPAKGYGLDRDVIMASPQL